MKTLITRRSSRPGCLSRRQSREAARGSTLSERLPVMSLFFILMMLLSLVFSLILVLTSWPGSSAALGGVDLSLYREPILWSAGGVLVACLFAALARIIHDLNRLVVATLSRQPEDGSRAED